MHVLLHLRGRCDARRVPAVVRGRVCRRALSAVQVQGKTRPAMAPPPDRAHPLRLMHLAPSSVAGLRVLLARPAVLLDGGGRHAVRDVRGLLLGRLWRFALLDVQVPRLQVLQGGRPRTAGTARAEWGDGLHARRGRRRLDPRLPGLLRARVQSDPLPAVRLQGVRLVRLRLGARGR